MMNTGIDVSLHNLLRLHWGASSFRDMQLPAVKAILDQRDVLLIAPTGFGKSLVFQLPALACPPGFAVVVSPLIALAKDQKEAALERGIEAEMWNSDVLFSKRERILKDICSCEPSLQLIYCTPEALQEVPTGEGQSCPSLLEALQIAHGQQFLKLIAIDEAHVVSAWGHDFRPTFRHLGKLREHFIGVPFIAVTATATHQVKTDISDVLHLNNPLLLQGSFNRNNIEYVVRHKELVNEGSEDSLLKEIIDFIRDRNGECGIIYARLRKTIDSLTSTLRDADIDTSAYHAGLSSEARQRAQAEWKDESVSVICATIAFGMGIDKPNVRWVIHYDPPSSLEGYSQESGRAGRDGAPSMSLMYCSKDDLEQIKRLEKGQRRGAVIAVADYALQPGCRRRKLLGHFGESRGLCNPEVELPCDHCSSRTKVVSDLTKLERVMEMRQEAATGCGEKSLCNVLTATNPSGEPAGEVFAQQQSSGRINHPRPTWQSAMAVEGMHATYRVGMRKPKLRVPLGQVQQMIAQTHAPAASIIKVSSCCAAANQAPSRMQPVKDTYHQTQGSASLDHYDIESPLQTVLKRRRLSFRPPVRLETQK
eukprot:jgi/Botrbrau1/8782/Bobra.0330s0014.1